MNLNNKPISFQVINKFKNLIVLYLFLFLYSCDDNRFENKQIEKNTYENFDKFYSKFHEDSLFQLSRIIFPVKGYIIDSNYNPNEEIKEDFITKEKWKLHKSNNLDGYKVEKDIFSDSIIETISIENSGFLIIRKFILKDTKWYLYYYSSQNL